MQRCRLSQGLWQYLRRQTRARVVATTDRVIPAWPPISNSTKRSGPAASSRSQSCASGSAISSSSSSRVMRPPWAHRILVMKQHTPGSAMVRYGCRCSGRSAGHRFAENRNLHGRLQGRTRAVPFAEQSGFAFQLWQ